MSRLNPFLAQMRLILLLTAPSATQAEEVIWTGEKTFDFYDCGMHDTTRITVRDPLTLIESGAVMKSMSALDIRIWDRSPTLAGIEVAHMIRKGQFCQSEQSGFAQYAALVG